MSAATASALQERWQRDLRAAFERYCSEHHWCPRDQLYLFFIAELLRWVRDEEGKDADEWAELAAGYAEVFPGYGGNQR